MKKVINEITIRLIIIILASVWCYGMMSICTNFQLDMLAVSLLSATITTGYISIKHKKLTKDE